MKKLLVLLVLLVIAFRYVSTHETPKAVVVAPEKHLTPPPIGMTLQKEDDGKFYYVISK